MKTQGHFGECRAVVTLIFFAVHVFAETLPWLQIIRDRIWQKDLRAKLVLDCCWLVEDSNRRGPTTDDIDQVHRAVP